MARTNCSVQAACAVLTSPVGLAVTILPHHLDVICSISLWSVIAASIGGSAGQRASGKSSMGNCKAAG